MFPPQVGLNWNMSKLNVFFTSVWLPCSTPSSHNFIVPVVTLVYHSTRCHTPSVTGVALTLASRQR